MVATLFAGRPLFVVRFWSLVRKVKNLLPLRFQFLRTEWIRPYLCDTHCVHVSNIVNQKYSADPTGRINIINPPINWLISELLHESSIGDHYKKEQTKTSTWIETISLKRGVCKRATHPLHVSASQTAGRPLHHSVTPAIKKTFPSAEKPQLILNDRPSKLYCRALWRPFAAGCSQYRFCDFSSAPLAAASLWGAGEWHVSFNGPRSGWPLATREKTEKSLIHTWFHV